MSSVMYAWIGILLILILLYMRWKLRLRSIKAEDAPHVGRCMPEATPLTEQQHRFPDQPVVIHRLCPHNNVIQGFEVEKKDSLDEHLDVLTRKLAEKEGRLKISKSKIRETQYEIDNLHALDNDVRAKYKAIMDSLKLDLSDNEKECMKLQDQIEWVSMKRAEIGDEKAEYHVAAEDSLESLLSEIKKKLTNKVSNIVEFNTSIDKTQMKMDILTEIDKDIRFNYNRLINNMKNDLSNNESECLKLQEQIYWLCKRRVEIGEEVSRTQSIFDSAASVLGSKLESYYMPGMNSNEVSLGYPSVSATMRHRSEAKKSCISKKPFK